MVDKPILQLNSFPVTIDPARYANALSNSNPNGSLTTLYAFRNLVDPIPNFAKYYTPSDRSTEETYDLIVNGASVSVDNSFTTRVIADAQKDFARTAFSNVDGTVGSWHPVYAIPEDWYDTSQTDRLKYVELKELSSQFTILGAEEPLRWQTDGVTQRSIDPNTAIQSIKFKYLSVNLNRPWLNSILFQTGGWFLQGQPKGFCSSGRRDYNNGIIFLITNTILIGKEFQITADWNANDKEYLELARSGNQKVSLGPFLIEPEEPSAALQIIGWVSSLIPFSPQETDSPNTIEWLGKTIEELRDSLSELYPTSIVITIENYTNIELKKIYEDKKSGLFLDSPRSTVPSQSAQGFNTYFSLDGGPSGWLVYSFDSQYNVALFWENFLTERNEGNISFVPADMQLTRENLERYRHESNVIRSFGGFICDATIGSGFQTRHGLSVTGQLDAATLKLMQTPRCGVPDAPFRLLGAGDPWSTRNLTYRFTNFTGDLPQAQVRTAVIDAMNKWAAVTGLTFTESGGQADIMVLFGTGDHGDGYPFDGGGGTLAHAFYPPPNGGAIAGDCHFDDSETWTDQSPQPAGTFDLPTVALHEIGHSLGLTHSSDSNAVMYAYYSGERRDLQTDDIKRISALYGEPVALQAYNGQYVCAEGGGGREVVANRDAIDGWEIFEVDKLGGIQIALTANNGQYVCAEGGGGREVVANRDAIGGWETFNLIKL